MKGLKSMDQGDKVKAFYNKVLDYDQNENWSLKFLQHIMEFCFIMLMPLSIGIGIEDRTKVWRLIFYAMLFLGIALYGRLEALIWIKEEGKNIFLSQKLKYMPISKKQFLNKKWQVLWRYVMKLTALTFSINLIIALAFIGSVSVFNLLPIGMGIYGLAIGLWMIKK